MDEMVLAKKRARITLWLKLAFATVLTVLIFYNSLQWILCNPYLHLLSLNITISPFVLTNILLCYVSTVFWLVRSYCKLCLRLEAGESVKPKVKNNWLVFFLIILIIFSSCYLHFRPVYKASSQNILETSEIQGSPHLAVETYFDVYKPYTQTNNLLKTQYKNRDSVLFEQKINFAKEVHIYVDISYFKGISPLLSKGSFAKQIEDGFTRKNPPPSEGDYSDYHYEYLNDHELLLQRSQGFEYYRFDDIGILFIQMNGNCDVDELQLKPDILEICRAQFDAIMREN